MSRESNLAKNTVIIAFGTFLPKLSSIITLPIITAELTKSEYGTYDLITILVLFFLPLVTFQVHSAAFRFLIDFRNDVAETKKIVSTVFTFIIPMSLFALVILFFCLFKLDTSTRLLICFYFFADVLLVVTQQIIRGFSNNKLYSASAVLQSLINMALVVYTLSFGKKGINGVLFSIATATFISAILVFIKGKILRFIDVAFISRKTMKELFAYSWPMIPNALSSWVLNFSNRIVLSSFLGLEASAIFSVANKIPSLLFIVQGTFVFAWQENASLAAKDHDVSEYYSNMFDRFFCVLAGIMALLIPITPFLFDLLVKGDYGDAYYQIPLLFLGVFFSSLSSFFGGIYVAHKKTKSVGLTTIFGAVCNLVINMLGVSFFGVFSASISTLVSFFLLALYRMIDVLKFQKLRYDYKKIMILLFLLVMSCGICFINNRFLSIANFLLGAVLACVINRNIILSSFVLVRKMFVKR